MATAAHRFKMAARRGEFCYLAHLQPEYRDVSPLRHAVFHTPSAYGSLSHAMSPGWYESPLPPRHPHADIACVILGMSLHADGGEEAVRGKGECETGQPATGRNGTPRCLRAACFAFRAVSPSKTGSLLRFTRHVMSVPRAPKEPPFVLLISGKERGGVEGALFMFSPRGFTTRYRLSHISQARPPDAEIGCRAATGVGSARLAAGQVGSSVALASRPSPGRPRSIADKHVTNGGR